MGNDCVASSLSELDDRALLSQLKRLIGSSRARGKSLILAAVGELAAAERDGTGETCGPAGLIERVPL
jgi:hypothetical protein